MAVKLNTKSVPVVTPIAPPAPTQFITIPCTQSYEFRVVEYEGEVPGKITSVELQVKINEHYDDGSVAVEGTWNPVPRIRLTPSMV